MNEWQYSDALTTATRLTLRNLDLAMQGRDSQEAPAAPFKLSPADLREVRQHLAAITNTVACARLVPTSANVPAERAERGYRRAAPKFT